MSAREYDPRTARWLQRDPIDVESGDPNLYRYCLNDPINEADDGFDSGSKQDAKQKKAGKQAQQATQQGVQGIPPGAEICPSCGGAGIRCNGLHEQVVPTATGVKYRQGYHRCHECNGLGYRPRGGWKGEKEDALNPIEAKGPSTPKRGTPTWEEVQKRGDKYGCHTCGTKVPNPEDKNTPWVCDHVPPNALNDPPTRRQTLRPQGVPCSRRQGGKVTQLRKRLGKWGWGKPPAKKKGTKEHDALDRSLIPY